MITLEQAKAAALAYVGAGLEISQGHELPDKWIFAVRNAETKEEPDEPPVSVRKEDGQVQDFFPPDHLDELAKMQPIEV